MATFTYIDYSWTEFPMAVFSLPSVDRSNTDCAMKGIREVCCVVLRLTAGMDEMDAMPSSSTHPPFRQKLGALTKDLVTAVTLVLCK